MNYKITFKYILLICIVLLISGCGEDDNSNIVTKDVFVGVWISWKDNQQFIANDYISTQFINDQKAVFSYSASSNGLYVFNYIVYKDAQITKRLTIASEELKVEDTVYEGDTVYNKAHILRTYEFPSEIVMHKMYEKPTGEVYIKDTDKETYYSQFGQEQTKQFKWNKYGLDFVFDDVKKLKLVTMTAYTINDKFIIRHALSENGYKKEYTVPASSKYVEFEETYVDRDGKETTQKKFKAFNTSGWTVNYSCVFDTEGVGKKVDIAVKSASK